MPRAQAKIIQNKKVRGKYFHLSINALEIAKKAKPGQFVNIKVCESLEPLLRRPLSIQGVKGKEISLFYEVVGKATEILSMRKPGGYLDIIGPLGNGFSLQPRARSPQPILVAGGMGTAPLVFLAEKLTEVKSQKEKGKILVLIGAKTKSDILCEKEFKELGCDVKIATDDGSLGFKGRVTELLEKILAQGPKLQAPGSQPTAIYACGPHPMLKAVAEISKRKNIPAQVSLEEHMSCGFGACLGCVVKTTNDFEYKRVCKEGPVFKADEIIWE